MTPRRALCAVGLVLALLTPAAGLAAEGEAGVVRAGRIGWDLLVIRPLGVVVAGISLVGAAVAYPFALPFDAEDHVTDFLVKDPIDRTFRTPLGEL